MADLHRELSHEDAKRAITINLDVVISFDLGFTYILPIPQHVRCTASSFSLNTSTSDKPFAAIGTASGT